MARNASGTYSRVVDDYVDGAVIRADDHNDEHDDFGAEITDSLNRSGKGGMLAGLKLINGLVGTPAFYFAGATTTGMYLNAAGDLRIALTAADIARFTAALVRIETALFVNGGIEGNSLAVSGNAQCGSLTCDAAATVGTTLDVTGEAECGTLDCLGNGAVGGTLAVTGNTTLGGTLTAAGNTALGGSVAAWVASTAYVIGNQVIANGNIYTCDTNGTSAGSGTGPSGTGNNIADGTTQWDYVSAAPTLSVAGIATFRSQASFTFGADMTNDKIVNVASGSSAGDAVNYAQLSTLTALSRGVGTFFATDTFAAAATRYLVPGYAASQAAEVLYWIAPANGTINLMRIYAGTAAVGSNTVFTARVNGVNSALTATLNAGGSSALDASNTVSVTAGDRIGIEAAVGAGVSGPGAVSVSFVFKAG